MGLRSDEQVSRVFDLPRNSSDASNPKILHVDKDRLVVVDVSSENVPFVQHNVTVRPRLGHLHRIWGWGEEVRLGVELFEYWGVEYCWRHD